MVPMDVPDVALEMMRTFMFSGSFDTSYQNMHGVIPSPSTCDCSGDGESDAIGRRYLKGEHEEADSSSDDEPIQD
jgi:hypothetical protein